MDELIKDMQKELLAERTPHDTRSNADLIKEALSLDDADEDAYWKPIAALWRRDTAEVLEAARQLSRSPSPAERRLGAHILSQLGAGRDVFHDERLAALLEMLDGEEDEDVLAAACTGLGHLSDPRAHAALIRLKNHPDEVVREAVAFGLSGDLDETGISALIELSADEDSHVRDWATFMLANEGKLDVPAIANALAARLGDPDEGPRFEAIGGLAKRKDARAFGPLIAELESIRDYTPYEVQVLLEAAMDLADPKLCASLLRLKNEGMVDSSLDEALGTCGCTLSSHVP